MPRPTGQELAELGREHRWPPGTSGNVHGRKLSTALTDEIDAEGMPKKLMMALIRKGLEGDVSALREILDRYEGKLEKTTNTNMRAVVEGIELQDRRPAKKAPESP